MRALHRIVPERVGGVDLVLVTVWIDHVGIARNGQDADRTAWIVGGWEVHRERHDRIGASVRRVRLVFAVVVVIDAEKQQRDPVFVEMLLRLLHKELADQIAGRTFGDERAHGKRPDQRASDEDERDAAPPQPAEAAFGRRLVVFVSHAGTPTAAVTSSP
jgi:hypothetical protein